LDRLNNLNSTNTHYYQAVFAIHELAERATAIYQSPKATPDDKRLLLSYIFSNISLNGSTVTADYTLAFEFLVKWVPKLNKIFEPTAKATNRGLISASATSGTKILSQSRESPENHFRTSNQHDFKPRFENSRSESRLLLAWLDAFRTYDWHKALPDP